MLRSDIIVRDPKLAKTIRKWLEEQNEMIE
jgi:hypothetical protein